MAAHRKVSAGVPYRPSVRLAYQSGCRVVMTSADQGEVVAADVSGIVRDGDDVLVGQIGGLDHLRHAALTDQQPAAGVGRGNTVGGEPTFRPPVAEDDV